MWHLLGPNEANFEHEHLCRYVSFGGHKNTNSIVASTTSLSLHTVLHHTFCVPVHRADGSKCRSSKTPSKVCLLCDVVATASVTFEVAS